MLRKTRAILFGGEVKEDGVAVLDQSINQTMIEMVTQYLPYLPNINNIHNHTRMQEQATQKRQPICSSIGFTMPLRIRRGNLQIRIVAEYATDRLVVVRMLYLPRFRQMVPLEINEG